MNVWAKIFILETNGMLSGSTLFFFIRTIYKNIEAQIWSEIFPKTMKNLKYDYGNFPNESLGQ